MRRRRNGGISGLGDLVAKVYPSASPEDRAMMMVQAHWARALPPSAVRNAMPIRIHGGVLVVHTTTAAWANTLQFEAETLLKQLQARVPGARLRRVDFRVGRLPQLPPQLTPDPEPFDVTPATELPEDVALALAKIHDDGVRDAVARAIATGLGRARRDR